MKKDYRNQVYIPKRSLLVFMTFTFCMDAYNIKQQY